MLFVDDFNRFTWFYPSKQRSDLYKKFLLFKKFVENQFNRKIKVVQRDWDGEHRTLNNFMGENGVGFRLACSHTHEQNRIAERKIRHIVNTGLVMLAHSNVQLKLWTHAFNNTALIINSQTRAILNNKTPFFYLLNKN